MVVWESKKTTIRQKNEALFKKFSAPESFKELMPQNLVKFETYGESGFSFVLKNMPEVFLEIKEKKEFSCITYKAKEGKLPFELKIEIEEKGEDQSDIKFCFSSQMNQFTWTMVKRPLISLIQCILENSKKFED